MDENRFKVLKGNNDNSDLYEEIVWERADKDEKVISLHPTALKATMSERRLRMFAENAEEHPEIEVTYSRFAEEDKKRKQEMDELREMFKGDDKVIVFDPNDRHI